MAAIFWMLLTLYPFVAHSQSGDDGESTDITCWSLMSLKQSDLICHLNECDLDICEIVATICTENTENEICFKTTMEKNSFSFLDLSPILRYKMHIHVKGGQNQTQSIQLKKIVKITTPEIKNATYKLDEAVIDITYEHEYVKKPDFQVEFWGEHSTVKEKITMNYQQIRIGGDKLQDSEIYNVRVRAQPVDFFSGSWTEWSATKSFKVSHTTVQGPSLLYIPLCLSPFGLIAMGFLIVRWKKEIQACLFPDIPDPKATLAQIHRQKEHLPMSFSPEIFKDINIYPVMYTEEKQFPPEYDDDQYNATESCNGTLKSSRRTSVCEQQDEDNQSLDSVTFQMKIKLLEEHEPAEVAQDNAGCQSVAALQRHSKDETYVTMSSLYKTQ
ncbi:interleukin-7 receptor subunit alpha [Silurus meridionalis]|uniref:Interleukin-7 receptor subunit alpha n=1 Tax=Silurus meridionalis TaxID=175797 RepID=A0A8T0AUT0_SILME|nr:interleukin-7 receptor subunit alpha [Silurus meridionalis]KAF7697054.1 hypothetical protein HF521_005472 [Silurus meridionalis]